MLEKELRWFGKTRILGGVGRTVSISVLLLLLGAVALAFHVGFAAVVFTTLILIPRVRAQKRLVALLLAAAVLLISSSLASRFSSPDKAEGQRRVTTTYSEWWRELDGAAQVAVAALEKPESRSRVDCFDLLARLHRTGEVPENITLLLLDRDSEAFAWDGPGLLHEPIFHRLPERGSSFVRGFTAVTLFEIAPIESPGPSFKILAGRSIGIDSWHDRPVRWSIVGSELRGTPADWTRIDLDGRPSLIVERIPESGEGDKILIALESAALFLVTLAGIVAFGVFSAASAWTRSAWIAVAVAAPSHAIGLPPEVAIALTAGSFLAVLGLLVDPRRGPGVTAFVSSSALKGATLGGLLIAITFSFHRLSPRVMDLGVEVWGSVDSLAWRLSWALGFFGLAMLVAPLSAEEDEGHDKRIALSTVCLLSAGALVDRTILSVLLIVTSCAAFGSWLPIVRRRPAALATALLLSALMTATTWETSFRSDLRSRLENGFLPLVVAPSDAELRDLSRELFHFFEKRDIGESFAAGAEDWGARPPDLRDLAFALWRDSPMPHRDALSALVLESYSGIESSSFAFGLGLDRDLQLLFQPEQWAVPQIAPFRDALLSGQAEISLNDKPWGEARYWFLPRPGLRLDVAEIDELERALVRGEAHRKAIDGLPKNVLWTVYDTDGLAVSSPWREAPRLEATRSNASNGIVQTPSGPAYTWRLDRPDHSVALFLPILGLTEGLERVAANALGAITVLIAALSVGLLVIFPRSTMKEMISDIVDSYSKRLIVASTILLLVPLIVLTLVLLRGFEERLRSEQLRLGIAAVDSARLLVVDYLLSLEPGFVIETQLDRELMARISRIVGHQVNLYWSGREIASSRQEMFTAGLLPRRIPGEAFSRLALGGIEFESRIRESGDLTYLEIYAPLVIPGVQSGHGNLFISTPLIEQEEEVGIELARTRRRAVLIASALFSLLVVVNNRLARRFTKPIMGLITETQRIAAGSRSVESRPRERELIALADAIDVMAHRVAEGRKKLLAEKQLIERMVEQIASGVVSLDSNGRILMQNLVASRSLSSRIGEVLAESLESQPRLEPVLRFVRACSSEPARETVRIGGEVSEGGEGDEGSDIREWSLIWQPLPGDEEPTALLVVDDATEVLRAQRLEAWAEMARIIAHEIKNPLTPIRLSAEHLRRVFEAGNDGFGEVLERCTSNILEQVEELRDIATDFSLYSRIPEAQLREADLVEVMQVLCESYNAAGAEVVKLVSSHAAFPARIDQTLLTRAVRNLVENSIRASNDSGSPVIVEIRGDSSGVSVRVEDMGPGVDDEDLEKIFDPYFSTYETGTGLGLAIAKRIVVEHGGSLTARNLLPGGFQVTIQLPNSVEPISPV